MRKCWQTLMEIIDDRYGRRATIIASQLPVSAWYDVLRKNTTVAERDLSALQKIGVLKQEGMTANTTVSVSFGVAGELGTFIQSKKDSEPLSGSESFFESLTPSHRRWSL